MGAQHNIRLFAVAFGGVKDSPSSVNCYATSLTGIALRKLVESATWTKLIRAAKRRSGYRRLTTALKFKELAATDTNGLGEKVVDLPIRANISISRRWSEDQASFLKASPNIRGPLKGKLAHDRKALTVVELFAGAGGMGLGFLLTNSGDRRLESSTRVK